MARISEQTAAQISQSLADEPGILLEKVAQLHSVTLRDVIACLPEKERAMVSGVHFVEVMQAIAGWGKVVAIVHTEDMVFEAKGEIARGKMGHGYYNIPGAIGGHFRPERISDICFVTRQLMKRISKSVQFISVSGECAFKVFLGRDEQGEILRDQAEKFDRLGASLMGT